MSNYHSEIEINYTPGDIELFVSGYYVDGEESTYDYPGTSDTFEVELIEDIDGNDVTELYFGNVEDLVIERIIELN